MTGDDRIKIVFCIMLVSCQNVTYNTRAKERFIMNAKNVKLVVLATASLAMLASCGNGATSSSKELTRTEAVAVLNKMAEKGKTQTQGVFTTSGKTVNVGTDFISSSFSASGSITVNSSSVSVAANSFYGAWKDGTNYTYYLSDGTTRTYWTTSSDTVWSLAKSGASAKINSYLGYATYAAKYAKYLGNFNDDGSAITGGTASNATMKSQNYTSTGDDNLIVHDVVHYSYDETLDFTWENNLCTNYRGTTCAWGSATTTKLTDATAASNDVAGLLLAYTVIASL
jgi:hypothetical protein